MRKGAVFLVSYFPLFGIGLQKLIPKKSKSGRVNCLGKAQKSRLLWRRLSVCDPVGTRTQDPYIKSVLLYQLSYGILPFLGSAKIRKQPFAAIAFGAVLRNSFVAI